MTFRPSHRQLEYFIAVADAGHFGTAARNCHVSQPTLSTQLKLLETQLGVSLIERGMQQAQPTPAGRRLLPMARNILTALDDFAGIAQGTSENLGGLVRLGVAPTIGPYLMPRILPHLHTRYPLLEVYIREERPQQLETDLASGLLDCVLTPLPLAAETLAYSTVCEEKILLGIPSDNPAAQSDTITVTMLKGMRMLTLGRGHKLFDQVSRLCEASGAELREDYEGTSLDALRQMVSIGMGVSLFPSTYVLSEFDKELNVTLREIEGWPLHRTICLAWRRDSVRTDHFRTLAEEARQASAIPAQGSTLVGARS